MLSDADVSVEIADGTLKASYDGRLDRIDPSIPFEEPRIAASLTGTGKLEATVRELLTRTTPMAIADYDVSGTLALRQSTLRDIELDTARVVATLRDSIVTMTELQVAGPALEGRGSGRLVLSGDSVTSDLQYELMRGDLAKLADARRLRARRHADDERTRHRPVHGAARDRRRDHQPAAGIQRLGARVHRPVRRHRPVGRCRFAPPRA